MTDSVEQIVPRDSVANALAKLLVVTQLAALNGMEASVSELSATAMAFVREYIHDHVECDNCNQIYRDGYRTGYMHAGGDVSRLPGQEEKQS